MFFRGEYKMTIDWKLIRPYGNSQNNAFEELVCQIAREENIPNKKEFYRVAAPDGGVEAYCVLDNEDEYGWQAKYFSSMGDSQWSQLKKSFETALERHPKLKKYYICIPLDRQDPRDGKKWFMEQWNEKTKAWSEYAKNQGRDIAFEYWGSSELIHRLSHEKHAGRRLFWFSKEEFSDDWFQSHVERNIKDLGTRYTPELNFELDISKNFDALSRNSSFRSEVKNSFHDFFIKLNKIADNRSLRDIFKYEVESVRVELSKLQKQYEISQKIELFQIDIDEIIGSCDSISESLHKCKKRLVDYEKDIPKDSLSSMKHLIHESLNELYAFKKFVNGPKLRLANNPVLVLSGEAGIGKSHLLADVASRRIEQIIPCALLLGQHFTSGESPWTQILNNLLRLKCNEKELLGALNAKAEARGERLLFIIDAINEGKGRYFWKDHIRGFVNDFSRYPWLGLVMSIRSSYVDIIIPENFKDDPAITKIVHNGFANNEYSACSFFFFQNGIELPSIPMLHPEFSNPLFLKLFCDGLVRSGYSRIPKGYTGITEIIDFFIESVDKKLSDPLFFDYPHGRTTVRKIINRLIDYKLKNSLTYVPYEDAFDIAEGIVGRYSSKRRFLDALISEGIFSQNNFWSGNGGNEEGVYLAYERFEDHLTVSYLLDEFTNIQDIKKSFETGGRLSTFIERRFYNQGIIEALSIQIPERFGFELYELLDSEKKADLPVIQAFVESLIWRRQETIKEKVTEFINEQVFHYAYSTDLLFQVMYSVSSDPNHPFNADRLHRFLIKFSMPERDALWTIYIHDKDSSESAMQRLIDWSFADEDKKYLSDDSRLLACKALAWLLTSTNIPFRDSATKALVVLLENNIPIATELLSAFHDVNDPYVYERIFAAIYGAVLRSDDLNGLKELSANIFKNVFEKEEVYPHVLVRDYARNIIEFALHKKLFECENQKKIRPPYKSCFPDTFPQNKEIDLYKFDYKKEGFKDYLGSQNRIISSMTTEYGRGTSGYGDFGRYTFQSALSSWNRFDPQNLSNYACQLIFEQYGYDVEKHGQFDRNAREYDRHNNRLERIGKKYQWIALYEVLARIADNHKMIDDSTSWSKKKKYLWYQGPWKPFIRNIDPTSIPQIKNRERKTAVRNELWWKKIDYNCWDGDHKTWITNSDNLPDPQKMIDIIDNENKEWVALERHVSWDEPEQMGREKYKVPHKSIWYQIRSYFVRKKEADHIISWARKQSFWGRWLPESHEQYQFFSREFYWSPAYRFFHNPYYGRSKWSQVHEKENHENLVGEVMITTEGHMWESGSDKSSQPSFLAPREIMHNCMNLQASNVNGEWVDSEGKIICFDPSAIIGGSSCLLVRKDALAKFLEENDLQILWICRGEKQVLGDDYQFEQIRSWLEMSGVYTLENGRVKGGIQSIVHGS